ncbi:MAG: glycosyltransferase [Planctomycetota bacterium]
MTARDDRTRVLFVIQGVELGGLEMVVRRIAEGLPREGYHCGIACFDTLGEMQPALEANGIEVFLEPRRPGLDWRYPFRLARRIREWRADVVHTHNATALFYGTLAARLAKVPAIYTEHDRQFPGRARTAVMNRWLARANHRIVTVSETLRESLIRHERFDPAHVEVIVNGVPDVGAPDPVDVARVRRELGLSESSVVIGTIGRLDPIKSHAELIRSFRVIAERDDRRTLVIIGSGPEAEALRAVREECGLERSVLLPGERREIAPYLAAFDLFVLPSKSEGMPVALIEAMAASKASVSMDVGGVGEVVRDGVEGRVTPPADWRAFEEAVELVLGDAATREAMGRRARQRFEAELTLSAMVEAYRSVYDSAVGEKAAVPALARETV